MSYRLRLNTAQINENQNTVLQTLRLDNGTAEAPAIDLAGNGTGLYGSATQASLTVAGSEGIRTTGNGLQIAQNGGRSAADGLQLTGSAMGGGAALQAWFGDSNTVTLQGIAGTGGFNIQNIGGGSFIRLQADRNVIISSTTNLGDVLLQNNGVTALTVDTSQNVTINNGILITTASATQSAIQLGSHTTNPSDGAAGKIYYDSTNDNIKGFLGAAWRTLDTSPDVPVDSAYTSLGAGSTFDLSTRKIFKRTVDANVTTFGFTGGEEDKTYKIYLKVDATGGYSFDYDYGNIETQDGIELILPSDPNSKHLFQVELLDNGMYLVYPIYNIERITRNTELTAGLGIQSATATGINPLISNSNAAGLATVTATATGINPLISNSNAAGLATVTTTATGNDSTITIT